MIPPRTLAGLDALFASTRVQARKDAVVSRITFEQIADGHLPQLDLMKRASEPGDEHNAFKHHNVIAICSRRAAKSTSICGLMAMDAAENDGVQIYFGKTKPAVRLSIWTKVWKPFCKRHKFSVTHNETSMVSTFASGAIVAFTGTDDKAHVESYLGNKLRRAILDEVQSQAPSVLGELIDRILPPALSDVGGQMILAGTIPDVPAGLFYEIWIAGEGWLKFNWSRFENPHLGTPEQQNIRLQEYLLASKRHITDPLVQRDWFGKFVFDSNATAYSYAEDRNGYLPMEPEWLEKFVARFEDSGDPIFEHIHRTRAPKDGTARHGLMAAVPFPGIEVYSCAIDPGANDRFSIEVIGWGSGTQKIQHVLEFSSTRGASIRWSQVDPIRRMIQEKYAPSWWYYDAGGSKVVLDSFVGDTGLPALLPAPKSGRHGQVERVNDTLLQGFLQIMQGSALEEDYQKCRWDADARAKMKWEMSSLWHPDPADSARYAMGAYFELFEEQLPDKSREEQEREAWERTVRRRQAAKTGQVLEEDLNEQYAIQEAEEESRWD